LDSLHTANATVGANASLMRLRCVGTALAFNDSQGVPIDTDVTPMCQFTPGVVQHEWDADCHMSSAWVSQALLGLLLPRNGCALQPHIDTLCTRSLCPSVPPPPCRCCWCWCRCWCWGC
jgi:hypothetical protein